MSTSSRNSDENRLLMERLATKRMGGNRPHIVAQPTSTPVSGSSTTPRSMPAIPASATPTATPIPTKNNENIAPTTGFHSPAPSQRSLPKADNDDIDMADAFAGPSLFGTPEQLAEARNNLNGFTRAGNKARPGRAATRQPTLDDTRLAFPANTATARPTTFSKTASPIRKVGKSTDNNSRTPVAALAKVAKGPGVNDVSALHDRPQVVTAASPMRTQAKDELSHAHPSPRDDKKDGGNTLLQRQVSVINSINSYKQAFPMSTKPPPDLQERVTAAGMPVSTVPPHRRHKILGSSATPKEGGVALSQTQETPASPAPPKEVPMMNPSPVQLAPTAPGKEEGAKSWQERSQEAVEEFRDKHGTVPPHRRQKMVTAETGGSQIDKTTSSATTFAGAQGSVVDTVAGTKPQEAKMEVQAATMQKSEEPEVRAEPRPETVVASKAETETDAKIELKSVEPKGKESPKTPLNTGAVSTISSVRTLDPSPLQEEELFKRVAYLEQDNANMLKQLQQLLQAEERRKFLGTDSAKEPFGLDVKLADGTLWPVQVHAELKVYELVRRICAKADLTLNFMSNPRIIVAGADVGHGMMLGEVGIVRDASLEVVFKFEG